MTSYELYNELANVLSKSDLSIEDCLIALISVLASYVVTAEKNTGIKKEELILDLTKKLTMSCDTFSNYKKGD